MRGLTINWTGWLGKDLERQDRREPRRDKHALWIVVEGYERRLLSIVSSPLCSDVWYAGASMWFILLGS
jgi:hypothetical protein